MHNSNGLTLLELLVVLVLITLIASVIVQGLGFFLGKYETVRRLQNRSIEASVQQRWFVGSVGSILPLSAPGRSFTGGPDELSGISLNPLAASSGLPTQISWQIVSAEDGAAELHYREDGTADWLIMREPAESLTFQYADVSGTWHDRWPTSPDTRRRIPRRIKIIKTGGETVWTVALEFFPEPVLNFLEAS